MLFELHHGTVFVDVIAFYLAITKFCGKLAIPKTVLQGYFSFQVTSHKEVTCPQSLVNCQYDYMGCSIKVIEQCLTTTTYLKNAL